jgi:hypothetical protein
MNITLFELHLDDATIAPALGGSETLETPGMDAQDSANESGRSWGRLLGLFVLVGIGAAAVARGRRTDKSGLEVEIGEETETVAAE